MKTYAYNQSFEWIEAEIKGEKRYYIEGFITTSDQDSANDVVTRQAQEDMLLQIRDRAITMDVDHEEFLDENGNQLPRPKNEKIPVAKIIHAEMKDNGIWVRAEINKYSGRFKEIWNSIKEGFLHSFSIAFFPVKAIRKNISGVATRFVELLSIINVTLTGAPINHNASFSPVMKAVLKSLDKEENQMTEENNNAQPPEGQEQGNKPNENNGENQNGENNNNDSNENQNQSEKDDESLSKQDFNELKEILENQKKQLEELVIAKEKAEAEAAARAKQIEEIQGPLANVKSENKKLKDEVAELKAQLDQPVLKSLLDQAPDVNLDNMKRNPLDLV